MNASTIMIITILFFAVGATLTTSEAATTFNRSTVLNIDETQRTVTFKTREGQTWTLPLADPDILKKQQVSKGDQVSIDIDLNDRITQVIKLSEPPRSDHNLTPDDRKP